MYRRRRNYGYRNRYTRFTPRRTFGRRTYGRRKFYGQGYRPSRRRYYVGGRTF